MFSTIIKHLFMKAKHLIIPFLLIILKTTLYAQNEELNNSIDSYFEKYVFSRAGNEKNNTAGVSIAITKKDEVLLIRNYGTADLKNKIPISEKTIFDLCSVSKQYTGMAISLLEKDGKISGNDKIIKYIPDLPQIMNEITINHLVHHTSGIRDWPILFGLKGWQIDEKLTLGQIIELLKKQDGLNFSPGSSFSYSNSNYNLLAEIIGRATDTTFIYWMRENIFIPMGMNNTFFIEDIQKIDNEACSYSLVENSYVEIPDKLNAPGSSSLRSNIADMSKWIMNFHTNNFGGKDVIDRMTREGKLNNNKAIPYANGLFVSEIKGKNAFYHEGLWAGFRTATVFFKDSGIGIVLLSNDGLFHPKKAINDIAEIVFGKEKNIKSKSNSANKDEVQINDEFFSLCKGKYEQLDDKGFFLSFFKKDGEYFVDVNSNRALKLYAKSDSVLYIKEAKAEFVFHIENGKVNSHTLTQNGRSYKAIKVKEEEEKRKDISFKNFSANYYSKELEVKYEIKYENSELKLRIPAIPDYIILKHTEGLAFSSNSGLIQSIVFINKKNKIAGFIINNSRAKNLLFERIN